MTDSTRSTRHTRCSPTRSAVGDTTRSVGPGLAGRRTGRRVRRASAASATSSTPSSVARRVEVRPGADGRSRDADLRYDLRITFEEAVKGTEKEIEFSVLQRCETCRGSRRQGRDGAGRSVPAATGAARSALSARRCSARWSTSVPASRCRGEGRIIESAVRDLPRRGPDRAAANPPGVHPGRHRRGPPDPPLERGRGRSPGRSGGQPVRRGPRPATQVAHGATARSSTTRLTFPSPRPHSARGSRSRRSTATRRSRSRPGPSPPPRSGCAARASRTCAVLAAAAIFTSWWMSSCRRSCRARAANCSRRTPRRLVSRSSPGGCAGSSGWVERGRASQPGGGRHGGMAGAGGRGGCRGGRGRQRDPRPRGAGRHVRGARVRAGR